MVAASFAALGLGLTTDQKAIRRAYATALKRIDQAADPQGFAALRSAYERARMWAEHQPQDDTLAAVSGDWLANDERPAWPSEQARSEINSTEASVASESWPSDGDARADAQKCETGQSQAQQAGQDSAEPGADQPVDPLMASLEALHSGVAYWTDRLMQMPDEELPQALAIALADERLAHLEARDALARSLALAIREQPDRRLALFNNARRVFDWDGVDAPIPHDPALSAWVRMLLEQMERYDYLPHSLRGRLDDVLGSARRRSAPSPLQAMWHADSFDLLLKHAPDLSVLDLGRECIAAWQHATKRPLRMWNWVVGLSITRTKILIAAVCVLGLVSMFHDARDGTTYTKEQPARAPLVEGRVTVEARRMPAEPSPCARQGPLGAPLGCPPLSLNQATPEKWPTATPQVPFITAQPEFPYPQDARVRAVKGMVWVRVLLDAEGKVQRKAIMIGSGNNALDQAAIDAAGGVRMTPAMQEGVAVPGQAVLVFTYLLGTR